MNLSATELPIIGCKLVTLVPVTDARGWFMKTFHADTFREAGMEGEYPETFVSESHKGVLRGMHFQRPPYDHAKLVRCLGGQVLDVLLDLRRESPTLGRSHALMLDATRAEMVYMPRGIAHGFLALTDGAVLEYRTSSMHAPSHDAGIHWASFGFEWPVSTPILSPRDEAHPRLADFISPF